MYTMIWYAIYDLRPGSTVGPILTYPEHTRGPAQHKFSDALPLLQRQTYIQLSMRHSHTAYSPDKLCGWQYLPNQFHCSDTLNSKQFM